MQDSDEVSVSEIDENHLRQGDIFRWENPDGTEWTEHGVVITADCDLLHNKMRGRVSYIPILRFETYIRRVWGVHYVEKHAARIVESAIAAIQRTHQEQGHSREFTEIAVRSWIDRDEPHQIADTLLPSDSHPKDRKKLEEKIRSAKDALTCERSLAVIDAEQSYYDRLLLEFPKLVPDAKVDPAKAIAKAVNDHCSSLPGDVFFISYIPGDGTDGYFGLLRHVIQCNLADISLDPIRRPGPTLPCRRIARLRAPYVYALTQNLARVFADIGLPDHHSNRLNESARKFLRIGEMP